MRIYNYTGLDIEVGIGNLQTIKCGEYIDLTINKDTLSDKVLTLKKDQNEQKINIPYLIKSNYVIAVGSELENGNVKLVNCRDNKFVEIVTSVNKRNYDEIISFKLLGLNFTKFKKKYYDELNSSDSLQESISNKLCSIPILEKLGLCKYNTINWLYIYIFIIIIFVVAIVILILLKNYDLKNKAIGFYR